jgi:RimJ/RimL family protein N-acetyltransferase
MAPDRSEPRDLVLAAFQENPLGGTHRVTIASAGTLGLVGAAFVFLEGEWLVLAVCIGSVAFLTFARGLGKRRSLVLRARDLFTVGGEIDRPVRWADLQGVDAKGMGVDLIRRNGTRIHLRLRFLDPPERSEAISLVIRHWEIYLLYGPLRLPERQHAEVRSGSASLRPVSQGDRDFCVQLEIDEDYHEHQLAVGFTREMAEAVFGANLPLYEEQAAFWKYVIIEDESPAGSVTVHLHDPVLRHAQVGISILAPFQNRGLGSKALRTLVRFLRDETNLVKLSAGCFADNHRCRRALEKAGMVHCGTLSKFWLKGAHWKDGLLFELDLERDKLALAADESSTVEAYPKPDK